jgi:hypothetical protein
MLEWKVENELHAKLREVTVDATKCNPGQSCNSRKFNVHAPFSGYASLIKFNAADELRSIYKNLIIYEVFRIIMHQCDLANAYFARGEREKFTGNVQVKIRALHRQFCSRKWKVYYGIVPNVQRCQRSAVSDGKRQRLQLIEPEK